MRHRLVTIPFSHFCEKARWSLDAAGVSYEEDGHCPGAHRRVVRRAGGRSSVPLLVRSDGEVLADSPLIVRFADAEAPAARKLLPAEGGARDEVLALEKRLDLDFAPDVRRLVYFHVLPDRRQTLRLFDFKTPLVERAVVRAIFPLLRRFMRRFMQIDAARAERSRDQVRRTFDEIGGRLADGRPFLQGDRFSAADIAFGALSAPMVVPEQHPAIGQLAGELDRLPAPLAQEIRELRASPAGLFTLRLYREKRTGLTA